MSELATTGEERMEEEVPVAEEPTQGSPSDFLKAVVGHSVVVRLNSGVDYRGVLSCLDGYMNIALEGTEEWVNGVKTNEYGDAFVRGNNGTSYPFACSSSQPRQFSTSQNYRERVDGSMRASHRGLHA